MVIKGFLFFLIWNLTSLVGMEKKHLPWCIPPAEVESKAWSWRWRGEREVETFFKKENPYLISKGIHTQNIRKGFAPQYSWRWINTKNYDVFKRQTRTSTSKTQPLYNPCVHAHMSSNHCELQSSSPVSQFLWAEYVCICLYMYIFLYM